MSFADLLEPEGGDDEAPVPLTPRERTQADTLTAWANLHLRPLGLPVADLIRDLRDGVRLARLLEALRGERVGRVIQKESIRPLEASGNISLALEVMKKDGAWVTNVDTDSIRRGKIDSVVSVLWSMIRRYPLGSRARLPPRKQVLAWCNSALHPYKIITNLTTDWNDGSALLGLIEYCQPGTCPNWHLETSDDNVSQCGAALQLAEGILRVPPVLSPEHLSSPGLDEVSMTTYLSLYLRKEGPGHQATLTLAQRTVGEDVTISNLTTDWNNGHVLSALAAALGAKVPGWPNVNTSDGNGTNQNALSAIRNDLNLKPLISSRELSNPQVDVVGVLALAALLLTKAPREPAPSPARPHVSFSPSVPDSGRLSSPGQGDEETGEGAEHPESGYYPGDRGSGAGGRGGEGDMDPETGGIRYPETGGIRYPETGAVRPHGRQAMMLGSLDMGQFSSVSPLTDSGIQDPIQEELGGPAIQVILPTWWRMKARATIVVDSSLEGPGAIQASAVSPSGEETPLPQSHVDKFRCHVRFLPKTAGVWQINILYMDDLIPGCPHHIRVYDPKQVTVSRRGDTGNTGVPYIFSVDCCRSELTELDVFILNDGSLLSHVITPTAAGTYSISFTPKARGVHFVNVFIGGKDIGGSPFKVNIVESDASSMKQTVALSTDPNSSSTNLAALNPDHVIRHVIPEQWMLGSTATLQFDTSPVVHKSLHVVARNPSGQKVRLHHSQLDHFNHHVPFTPGVKGTWELSAIVGEAKIDGSPFSVNVFDPMSVQVQRLTHSCIVEDQVKFDVDLADSGCSDLDVCVLLDGQQIDHVIEGESINRSRVHFTPMKAGVYTVIVNACGGKVRGSPFDIEVLSSAYDAQSVATGAPGVLVTGSGLKRAVLNAQAYFAVDTSVSPGPIALGITGPDGMEVQYSAQQKGGGRVEVAYLPTQPGKYKIEVEQNDEHVHGSPFRPVIEGTTVHIKNLANTVSVGALSTFIIDASAARKGKLDLDGDISIQRFDREDRQVYSVTFTTFRVGLYDIFIKYDGHSVPGSPFQIESRM